MNQRDHSCQSPRHLGLGHAGWENWLYVAGSGLCSEENMTPLNAAGAHNTAIIWASETNGSRRSGCQRSLTAPTTRRSFGGTHQEHDEPVDSGSKLQALDEGARVPARRQYNKATVQ